jgi:arylsulfatase A-like enzyme
MVRARSLLPACTVGALVAASLEGWAAASATLQADSSRLTAVLAFAAAAAVILAPALVLALLVEKVTAWANLLGTRWTSPRPPGQAASERQVARGRLSWPWRLTVQIALVGEAATLVSILGRRIIGSMSAHFAATLIVLLALAGGAVALLVSRLALFLAQRLLAWALERYPARRHLLSSIEARFGALVLTATGLLVANALMPAEQFATPAVALVAGVIFHTTSLGERLSPRWVVRATCVAALLAVVSLRGVERLPGRARQSVLYRTPWASLTLGALRHGFDHDHDGYSPYFGGGDCNDHDASIHPDAVDVPGDGIDQNCSGADAPAPAPEPSEPARSSTRSERWSFVLVHIDALRPDHLSFAGYPRHTSPNLDAFRETATYFSDAYSLSPATRYAMSSLFTGKDVDHMPQQQEKGFDFRLLPEAKTLAERLEPLGYDRVGYTIAYVLQHIPGVGQGFRIWDTPWPMLDEGAVSGKDATLTTDKSNDYLDTQAARAPFLLYAHYQCTHMPYVKHPEWDFGDELVDRYDSALAYCDKEVGRLLEHVQKRDDHDHIAVIVFSDHGELLGEHGLGNHGTSLFQEELRSLLLVHLPWQTPRTIDTRVTLTDLYPTLLELAGAEKDTSTHAWSLVPLFDGTARAGDWKRPLYLYIDQWRGSVHFEERGVLDGSYKYVRDVASGASFLYDEETTPHETKNLRRTLPSKNDRLAGMVDAQAARTD